MKDKSSLSPLDENFSKNKAYTIIIIFLALLILLFFMLSKFISFNTISTKESTPSASSLVDINSYTEMQNGGMDSNNNGIPNWQEVAMGLNPSDNNVGINNLGNATNTADEKINYFSNFTELISRDIYVTGQYKTQDNQVDIDSINGELINKLNDIFKPIRINSIDTISNPTKDDYLKYYGEMAILLYYMRSSEGKELEEAESNMASSTNNWDFTANYTKNLYYLCADYKNQKVPKDLVELHKDAIYLCEDYALTLYGFTEYSVDPVKSQIATNKYKEVVNNIYALVKTYSDKVKAKGYSADEIKNGKFYYLIK
ncbi:MAG: hypothetical protein QG614_55 [Patescibacteria group bacterium]|nr:hypothetical protein [Patescibacteria group bacterium]